MLIPSLSPSEARALGGGECGGRYAIDYGHSAAAMHTAGSYTTIASWLL